MTYIGLWNKPICTRMMKKGHEPPRAPGAQPWASNVCRSLSGELRTKIKIIVKITYQSSIKTTSDLVKRSCAVFAAAVQVQRLENAANYKYRNKKKNVQQLHQNLVGNYIAYQCRFSLVYNGRFYTVKINLLKTGVFTSLVFR